MGPLVANVLHDPLTTTVLQAFESVVPSERTQVNVKVHDTSIRLYAPTHKGALLSYIEELEFSTVIEGNSPIISMNLGVPSFSLLLVDDLTSNDGDVTPARASSTAHGVSFWKVNMPSHSVGS